MALNKNSPANRRKFFNIVFKHKTPINTPYTHPVHLVREGGLGKRYPVRAIHLVDAMLYGCGATITSDEFILNVPDDKVSSCREVVMCSKRVKAINDGKLHFYIEEHKTTRGTKITVTLVDGEELV